MRETVCSPSDCTLCMACANACPKQAIYVGEDEYGYEKIVIDRHKCIDCGICLKVCNRRANVPRNIPALCYAAQARDAAALANSASGGAFQMLAVIVLEMGGVCYGCEFAKIETGFSAKHIRIDTVQQLSRILNSKYIPSMIGNVFQLVEKDLETGRQVLFSGTPCQVQGLRAYLNKHYDGLLTADLVCHGITGTKYFNEYVKCVEERDKIWITDYAFRDKSISWGTNFRYNYLKQESKNSCERTKHCPREESSYMMHYLRGNLFRENCYACDLSCTDRVSDFTLGDYWGVEQEHPEFVNKGALRMSLRGGISCILMNTEKAKSYMQLLEERMILNPVILESISNHNGNLREPSHKGGKREWILNVFRTEGYAPIENEYRNSVGRKMIVYRLKNLIKSSLPDCIRIRVFRSALLRRVIFHQ